MCCSRHYILQLNVGYKEVVTVQNKETRNHIYTPIPRIVSLLVTWSGQICL